jgi:peptidyl-prolyl cis-trans isomerase A (cyclophilin A)
MALLAITAMTAALVAAPLTAALAAAPVTVVLETSLGTIEIELNVEKAPRTTANFLRYIDAGHYDGGRFHRTVKTNPDNQPQSAVKIDVIQAGARPGAPQFEPIALESTSVTGLKHLDGAVSMARSGPDSATSDIFICIGDQPSLDFGGARNPDGQGFAAFGRVVKGMDVVRRIQTSPAQSQALAPPVGIRRALRRNSNNR